MSTSLYLVNPRPDLPSYFGADAFERWGYRPAVLIADLAITTVAGMAPPDFDVELCDEHVGPIDFDTSADYVGLTGKVTQGRRMIEAAAEFRRRGKTVLIGGPYASLCPELMRPHCDILVKGEMENIADTLFADLRAGSWKDFYEGDQPDLSRPVVPRWDLYPNDRALIGCVQTSRGCPFECEFCDVIQYLGRKQRHKSVDHILAELDQLHTLGYRNVFLADDNFTVYRHRAKEVLEALRSWNDAKDEPIVFYTQVSIDAARDPEMLDMMALAGLRWVFIGIESPDEESLKEIKKRQNTGIDILEHVNRFLEHGIAVSGGMIVGFDADDLDVFRRQYEFAMASPIPTFSLTSLVAPAATPLYDRMKEAGRLSEDGTEAAGTLWDTNIVPTKMTREELFAGLRWLCNSLYRPEAFAERTVRMIETLGSPSGGRPRPEQGTGQWKGREVSAEGITLLRKLIRMGSGERKMWSRIYEAMEKKPESHPFVMTELIRYAQVRTLYERGRVWEPEIASGAPALGAAPASPLAP